MTNALSKPIYCPSDLIMTAQDLIFKSKEGRYYVVKKFKKTLKHEKKRKERFLIPLMDKLKGKHEDIIIIMIKIHMGLCDIYKAIIENNSMDFIYEMKLIIEDLKELLFVILTSVKDISNTILVLFTKYKKKYSRIVDKMYNFENSGYFVDL